MFSNNFDYGIDSYEYQVRQYEPDMSVKMQQLPRPSPTA
jgi:hypothetical protein